MNLLNDFVLCVKNKMDEKNISYNNCNNPHEYILRYIEVNERIINFDIPYSIIETDCFIEAKCNLDNDEKSLLNDVILKINNGDNIDLYMPSDICKRKFDYLLSNWRIHHIHLQHKTSDGKFIYKNNAKIILFVINNRTKQIGFIDIIEHPNKRGWFKKKWLEEIDSIFEDFLFKLDFIDDIEYDINDDAIIEDAEKNTNLFIKVNGKVVSPNMGVATSGNSISAVMSANDLCNYFNRLQLDIINNINKYRALIKITAEKHNFKLGKNIEKLDFTVILEKNNVVLYEQKYLIKFVLFDFEKYCNANRYQHL